MKRALTCFGLAIVAVWCVFGGAPKAAVFVWDYPVEELGTNLTFLLHSTNNLAAPTAVWPVRLTVVGTNTSCSVPMNEGWQFFYVTASNEWGESDPSNVVTAKVWRMATNLNIRAQ